MVADLAMDQVIASATDLAVGEGIYSEKSETPYWVVEKTRTQVVLENADGQKCTWLRETLDESFAAHRWVRQSRSHPAAARR